MRKKVATCAQCRISCSKICAIIFRGVTISTLFPSFCSSGMSHRFSGNAAINSFKSLRLSVPNRNTASISSDRMAPVSVNGRSESLSMYRFSAEKICRIKSPTLVNRLPLFGPAPILRTSAPCCRRNACHFSRSQSVYSIRLSTLRSMPTRHPPFCCLQDLLNRRSHVSPCDSGILGPSRNPCQSCQSSPAISL